MAVSDVTSLSISKYQLGIQVTKVTDSSSDWASVSNSTYFYDKTDNLVHYKDGSGNVLEIFSSSGGLTYFTETGVTTSPNATIPVAALIATSASTNMDVAIVPKGNGALLVSVPDGTGLGRAKRGQYALDLQLYSAYYTRVASGNYSVALGRDNTASGTDSVSIGYDSNASATQSLTIGRGSATQQYTATFGHVNNATSYGATSVGNNNTASGQESIALGTFSLSSASYASALGRGITASGTGSIGLGFNTNTYNRYGALSWAGGSSNNQVTKMIYRGVTTNSGSTDLNAQEYFSDANNTFSLQNNSAYRFKGTVIGKKSGTTDVAAWDIDGLIVRGANAASTTLLVSNVNVLSNLPGWGTPLVTANTTYGSLFVNVIGSASTNIRWTVSIEATEVIYA
jgi:hypothetical protein